jgi:hypothetical protein
MAVQAVSLELVSADESLIYRESTGNALEVRHDWTSATDRSA